MIRLHADSLQLTPALVVLEGSQRPPQRGQ
jgi:hypothetical protein